MYTKAVRYFSAISLNERIRFLKLLLRWQGSVWKLLWFDFLCFFVSYVVITLIYRLYLVNYEVYKRNFETIVIYMNKVAALVPLSFLLGFFVSTILSRWWTIVNSIPWMSQPAFNLQALLTNGDTKTCTNIRLTIIRYLNLAWILSVINLSQKVKHRFSVKVTKSKHITIFKSEVMNKTKSISIREKMDKINSDKIVKNYFGQLITEEEIKVFENFEEISKKPVYFIPLMWTTKLLEKAFRAGHIRSESVYMNLFNMIQTFKNGLENLSVYNEFNVPLVYTQVIIIVVYTFLISEIFSEQIITPQNKTLDAYFPIFGIFKFLIYMGWFKVGLSFINPFGSDPSDLPLDEIFDYNLEMSASVARADDIYYPDYLSDSCMEAKSDPFKILETFCEYIPFAENIPEDIIGEKGYSEKHLYATRDETDE